MQKSQLKKIIKETINEYLVGDLANAPPELQDIVSKLTTKWKKYKLSIGANHGTYAIGLPSSGINSVEMEFLLTVMERPFIFYRKMLPSPITNKQQGGQLAGLWVDTGINIPREIN